LFGLGFGESRIQLEQECKSRRWWFLGAPHVPRFVFAAKRRSYVNWEQLHGNWMRMKLKVKERWDRLTDEELSQIGGRREPLLNKLLEKYGLSQAEAERQLSETCDEAERELQEIQEEKFDERF
jgi:uncharacterized protein YjbJ (UPF0337 family)